MRQISLCITTYNRTDLLYQAFEKVYDIDEISEIVICDDCSRPEIYDELKQVFSKKEKIKLFRNERNVDCYFNKRNAIEFATNDWVIILDSDNQIDFSYINFLYQIKEWDKRTIYAPSYAMPVFDYRAFEGLFINKYNVAEWMDQNMFKTLLNTFNFFVNRNEYLKVWDGSIDPVTSDSEYFNYCWLKSGREIFVVPGLSYQHRVDNHQNEESGHYNKNVHRTPPNFHNDLMQKFRELR